MHSPVTSPVKTPLPLKRSHPADFSSDGASPSAKRARPTSPSLDVEGEEGGEGGRVKGMKPESWLLAMPSEVQSHILQFLPVKDMLLSARASVALAEGMEYQHTVQNSVPRAMNQSLPLFSVEKYRASIRPWLAQFGTNPQEVMDFLTGYNFFPNALCSTVTQTVEEAGKLKLTKSSFLILPTVVNKVCASLNGSCIATLSESARVQVLSVENGNSLKAKKVLVEEDYCPIKWI